MKITFIVLFIVYCFIGKCIKDVVGVLKINDTMTPLGHMSMRVLKSLVRYINRIYWNKWGFCVFANLFIALIIQFIFDGQYFIPMPS